MQEESLSPEPCPCLARGDLALVVGIFLLALVAYVATSAPGIVAEGDCAEYVTAARVAGIPHAPGFPTYMLLASAIARVVPAEQLARALNLASAFFGALTLALVALAALRIARSAWPEASAWIARGSGLLAAVLLGGATEFWNQSLSAEVYTLATALLALCLERWSAGPSARRLAVLALAAGLAFGVHYNAGVPGALLAAAGAWSARRALGWRGGARLATAFALGLSTFLYLPLRSLSDPVLDFGDPETPERFARMLTLADMPTGKAFARELALLGRQVGAVAGLASGQWPGWAFALSALGLAGLALVRRTRAAAAALVLVLLLDYAGILAMSNFAPVDEEIYELRFLFLPAYLALALAAGLGLGWIAARLERRAPLAAPALPVLALVALAPWLRAQALRLDKRGDRVMEEYGHALLAAAEGPAILFTWGDNAWMPVQYLQDVRGLRGDVTLIAAGLLRHPWYRAQLRARHPALVLDEGAPGVAGIARANVARVNLYHADPRTQSLRGFQEVPSGLLMRIVPEGEPVRPRVPPAPEFSAPHAVLDLRETSVRADCVQAYVRTAAWCRAGGHLDAAEQALREGLAIALPEPRMEEFHLARAGLWLELGDLEASRGRLAEARAAWEHARDEAPGTPPAELAEERTSTFFGADPRPPARARSYTPAR